MKKIRKHIKSAFQGSLLAIMTCFMPLHSVDIPTINCPLISDDNDHMRKIADHTGGYIESMTKKLGDINSKVKTLAKKKKEQIYKYIDIPLKACSDGTPKTYMDLNKITCRESKQYKMKSKYSLDSEGHYYYMEYGKKFYVIALGDYFGDVGDKFKITLSSGTVFYAIKGDSKADKDTIESYCHKRDRSVIEFIISTKRAIRHYGGRNGYVLNGNFNNDEKWEGSIERVQKVCRM